MLKVLGNEVDFERYYEEEDRSRVDLDGLCEELGRSRGEVERMLGAVGAVDLGDKGWCRVSMEKEIEGLEGLLEVSVSYRSIHNFPFRARD